MNPALIDALVEIGKLVIVAIGEVAKNSLNESESESKSENDN